MYTLQIFIFSPNNEKNSSLPHNKITLATTRVTLIEHSIESRGTHVPITRYWPSTRSYKYFSRREPRLWEASLLSKVKNRWNAEGRARFAHNAFKVHERVALLFQTLASFEPFPIRLFSVLLTFHSPMRMHHRRNFDWRVFPPAILSFPLSSWHT